MDACYGGLMLQRQSAFGSMRFLGDMLKRYARQVLTAGKADEAVADGNGVRPGHSIFTGHLIEALEGAASTKEGVISASGVMAYVYERVAKDQFSTQTPHYGFFDGDGDFIFDTSLLEEIQAKKDRLKNGLQKNTEHKPKGERGENDILINTSPQLVTMIDQEPTVADTVKDLLSDVSKRIKLDDYVSLYVRRFLEATDLRNFPVQGSSLGKDEFIERIQLYEEATADLQQIVILLSKWGDSNQLHLLEKIFTRVAEADKGNSGLLVWIHLSWYPLHLLMYSAGIAALYANKYDVLRIIFQTKVQDDPVSGRDPKAMAVILGSHLTQIHDQFKWLPGQEKKYVPRSEHLFKTLQPVLEDTLFLGRSYERLFDAFEVMWALVYADLAHPDRNIKESAWGPPGRFGWKHDLGLGGSPLTQVVEEAKKEGENWEPVKVGLFQHSVDRFFAVSEALSKTVKGWSYW